jgi:WD40 repeat protein
VLGSPNYVPPEQAEGRSLEIGPASDVYSLGAILYHLLTGRPPFQADSVAGILRQVSETEPLPPRRLDDSLPPDLETICLKCLEKDPRRRYASAQALADDLGRFQRGEPIQARSLGSVRRLGRWVGRNPLVAGLGCTAILFAVAIAAGSTLAALWLMRAEQLATTRLFRALLAQAQASRWSGRPGCRFASLDALRQSAELRPRLQPKDAIALPLRNEVIACLALADLRLVRQWHALRNPIDPVGFDADLELYTLNDFVDSARLRRVTDDVELATFRIAGEPFLHRRLSPDGQWLALKHRSGRLRVWHVGRHELNQELESRDTPALEFCGDSRWLAADRPDGSIQICDLRDGTRRDLPDAGLRPYRLHFSPDARQLAVVSLDPPGIRVWDLTRREGTNLPHPAGPRMVSWRPDGHVLAVAGSDRRVLLWDTENWQSAGVIAHAEAQLDRVMFHPDGSLLATWGTDGATRLWDAASGRLVLTAPGTEMIQFSRDGRRLAFKSGLDLGLWEIGGGEETRLLTHPNKPAESPHWSDAVYSPDGRWLAVGCRTGVCLWETDTHRDVGFLTIGYCEFLCFSPQDGGLITCSPRGVQRWPCHIRTLDRQSITTVGPPETLIQPADARVRKATLSGDGTLLAVETRDRKTGRLWDWAGRRWLATLEHPQFHDIALSADGRWAAAGNWHAWNAVVWDAHTGRRAARLETTGSTTVAFSPDNRWLVTGTGEEYRVWHLGSWQPAYRVPRQKGGGYPGVMAFSPDSRFLAATLSRNQASLLETATGREVASFDPPASEWISALRFRPDGAELAVVSDTQGVRVWNLRRLREQLDRLKLDWEALPLPPAPSSPPSAPLTLTVFMQPILDLPERAPNTPQRFVDLSGHFNASLAEGWHTAGANPSNNLAMLPTGRQLLGSVEFDVRGVVQLAGRPLRQTAPGFPKAVHGIPIAQTCRSLHFLHAAGWDERSGTRIGGYRIHYADGQELELPLVFGQNIDNWFPRNPARRLPSDATLAWSGKDPVSGGTKRLFRVTWPNARPDAVIDSLDFFSDMTGSAPFLIAVTVEP